MTTLEVLKAAREKIADPAHWTQGEYSLSAEREKVGPTSSGAVCYCAIGALCAVTRKGGGTIWSHPAYKALDSAVSLMAFDIADFNDTHSHEDVLDVYDRAIAVEEAKATA